MKVAVFPLPAYGHVNPTLPIARELSRRGDEVTYYLSETFAGDVEAVGARLEPLDDSLAMHDRLGGFDGEGGPSEEQVRALVEFMGEGLAAVPDLRPAVESAEYDVLLYDQMCVWGHALANVLDVPAVALNSSFAFDDGTSIEVEMPPVDEHLPPAVEELVDRYDLPGLAPPDLFRPTEALNVVPVPRVFQPAAASFGEEYVFVGALVRDEDNRTGSRFPLDRLDRADGRRVLYVSLGSVVGGDERFLGRCAEAFGGTDWLVVLKASEAARETVPLPENFVVRSWIPQLAVLRRADVFVTHGGMNSTMEAVQAGVPLVVVPRMSDQRAVADQVRACGVGTVVDPDELDAETLRERVATVASDRSYGENVERLSDRSRSAGGAERAADAIDDLVGRSRG
jgi:MGT family glycosyltransferase